jgi:MATE family multidrug resistance protein
MCLASVVVSHRMRPFKKFRVLGHVLRADWPLLRALVVIGAPI